jgi:hypothetical protein
VTADTAVYYPCIDANDGVPLAVLLLLLQDYTSLVMNATGWDGWVAAELPAAR